VARCGATLTVTNRDRPTTASEIFAILQASSLGFAKIHTGPYATSVISTDFIEDVCGLMCILTKPNNETCKIVNSSLLAGFLPLSLSRAHRKEGRKSGTRGVETTGGRSPAFHVGCSDSLHLDQV
jgi:hypothetical protein